MPSSPVIVVSSWRTKPSPLGARAEQRPILRRSIHRFVPSQHMFPLGRSPVAGRHYDVQFVTDHQTAARVTGLFLRRLERRPPADRSCVGSSASACGCAKSARGSRTAATPARHPGLLRLCPSMRHAQGRLRRDRPPGPAATTAA